MYSLVLLEEAKQEWLDSAVYYEIKQKGLGERFSKAAEECLELIIQTPSITKRQKKNIEKQELSTFLF